MMSLDGTDCPVNEPWSFDKKWYSQKFNGHGVKYEVGVCIKTGYIVWINGPVVASMNDLKLFKSLLMNLLCEDEGVEVDVGYNGADSLNNPQVGVSRIQRCQKNKVRGRHENVNGRLKIFNVLNIPFRHLKPHEEMMEKHHKCFYAVAVITQLKFEAGEMLYDIQYDTGSY
jgi:hypothetical protein